MVERGVTAKPARLEGPPLVLLLNCGDSRGDPGDGECTSNFEVFGKADGRRCGDLLK